jgi:hypothetical protein
MKIKNSVIGATGLMLLAAVVFPSTASADETVTTFELTGGPLTLSTAGTATLAAGTTGDLSVTGSLGDTTVTDPRGVETGWIVTTSSTSFLNGATTITPADVAYASGAVAETGTVDVATTDLEDMTVATAVATATASGNNIATWNPTLTVTLPASALAGTYTGTITTSVA